MIVVCMRNSSLEMAIDHVMEQRSEKIKLERERAVEEGEKGLTLCGSPAPFVPLLVPSAVTDLPPCSECLPVPFPCWTNLTLGSHLHHRPHTSYTWGKTKKQQGELETLFRAVLTCLSSHSLWGYVTEVADLQ